MVRCWYIRDTALRTLQTQTVDLLTRYSDGGVFAIPSASRVKVGIATIGQQYGDQKFTVVFLNRGSNLISCYFKPLLGNEELFEVPVSSPGIILNDVPFEKLFNGIEAIASTATTNLMVNVYSNDIELTGQQVQGEQSLFPRDTVNAGVV
jgi:hypothetical protein